MSRNHIPTDHLPIENWNNQINMGNLRFGVVSSKKRITFSTSKPQKHNFFYTQLYIQLNQLYKKMQMKWQKNKKDKKRQKRLKMMQKNWYLKEKLYLFWMCLQLFNENEPYLSSLSFLPFISVSLPFSSFLIFSPL